MPNDGSIQYHLTRYGIGVHSLKCPFCNQKFHDANPNDGLAEKSLRNHLRFRHEVLLRSNLDEYIEDAKRKADLK
jgi:hypothetical protein